MTVIICAKNLNFLDKFILSSNNPINANGTESNKEISKKIIEINKEFKTKMKPPPFGFSLKCELLIFGKSIKCLFKKFIDFESRINDIVNEIVNISILSIF